MFSRPLSDDDCPGTNGTSIRATPHPNLREEAVRVLHAAEAAGLTVRAVGGIAVALQCPSTAQPPLAREYKDLDVVGLNRERKQVKALLAELGYIGDDQFNALHGASRWVYWDTLNGRPLDVFFDRIAMCHVLELAEGLRNHALTLSPADLLLTKLQVLQTSETDLKDAVALLLDCEIDYQRIAHVLSQDWGWWRTVTEVLGTVVTYGRAILDPGRFAVLEQRIASIREQANAAPKSFRWKRRALLGDRVRWYETPDEESP